MNLSGKRTCTGRISGEFCCRFLYAKIACPADKKARGRVTAASLEQTPTGKLDRGHPLPVVKVTLR
ncbi:hypothetical protein P7H21_10245 [Paenibacillus larvae]|nr:hypothetical protein [Paenibacillus larvae]MDT2304268.1 hypothetical protein [Paenibacillus larvae]